MFQKQPCMICRRAFREKALVAYHAWYNGENRVAYKQRMCLECWRKNYATLLQHSLDQLDSESQFPETCYSCGGDLTVDGENTWSTWYRGRNRKDTVVATCAHCGANLRTVMMNGADRQPDRELSGVGAGGAPLPNPPGFGRVDDLPW